MNTRLIHSKTKGQSITLIAIVLVVLLAMVGLSVDVGNTYAQQRNVVRATNSAAISGMNAYLRGGANPSDSTVYNAVRTSLQTNGVNTPDYGQPPTGDQRTLDAEYLDESGNPMAPVGGG